MATSFDLDTLPGLSLRPIVLGAVRFVVFLLLTTILWVETPVGSKATQVFNRAAAPMVSLLQPLIEPAKEQASQFLQQGDTMDVPVAAGRARPLLGRNSLYTWLLAPALCLLLPLSPRKAAAFRFLLTLLFVTAFHYIQVTVHALVVYRRAVVHYGGRYTPEATEVSMLSGLNFSVWPILSVALAVLAVHRYCARDRKDCHD